MNEWINSEGTLFFGSAFFVQPSIHHNKKSLTTSSNIGIWNVDPWRRQ